MESTDLLSAMSGLIHTTFHVQKMNCPLMVKRRFLSCVVQKVNFDGHEGVSQPVVDSEDTETEWKLFWRLIFTRLIFAHDKGELNISSIINANLSW